MKTSHIFWNVVGWIFLLLLLCSFCFSKWLLSYLCFIKQTARPQHLSQMCCLPGLSPGTQKEDKGVHWSEVFCSLTCWAHQCKGTSVMSQGANSWSQWSHWDLHRKFLAELPFISIRLGFGSTCLSSWLYLLSFIALSNTFSQCISKHTKALQSTVAVYNVLCHSHL